MLIGITGAARSGKDTVANFLWRRYGFTRIAFADPMKKAAQAIFGLSDEQTWSNDLKEVNIPYWGMSPRRMFQMLGTEAMQSTFGRDVWIKRWKLSYDMVCDVENVVVPDVRFNAEAEAIRSLGGMIIKLCRDEDNGLAAESKAHVSENGIELNYLDATIFNQGSIQSLEAAIAHFVEYHS